MSNALAGIHHVTAVAGDPQRNIDFYTGMLGLRLVKVTVNFDDPSAYHLYYGDRLGRPGTVLSFLVRPDGQPGRNGPGQATIVAFAVPLAGLRYWAERLEDHRIAHEGPIARFGDRILTFRDPDNLQIELVGQSALEPAPERFGPVPQEYGVQRVCGITIAQETLDLTHGALSGPLGFRFREQDRNRYRYEVGETGAPSFLDILVMPRMLPGRVAVGTIHHIAWRAPDEAAQTVWGATLAQNGIRTSPMADRLYFRSIYFREPGGALFEIATDGPGFTIDQTGEELGSRLMLPPWLEARRAVVQGSLPALRLPQANGNDNTQSRLTSLSDQANERKEWDSDGRKSSLV